MISNKDLRVEGSNLIINGEKHQLDPAVDALIKRANTVQGKLSALDTKLDAIEALEKTASGNPISLTGVAAAYAMSNIMTIEPVQSGSGDPSPTNVRPISGISEAVAATCGKNLFDKTNYLDKTYINDTTGELVVEQNAGWITTPLIHISGISSLTMQGNKVLGTVGAVRYRVLDFDKNIISVVSLSKAETGETNTFTNLNGFYFQMCFRNENGALDACQIEEGTVATPYEPYTANTATITFGQTVYGGSVNFKTGEVTVTHGYIEYDGITQTNWSVVQYTNLCAFIPLPEVGTGHRTFILSNIFKSYELITNKPNGTNGISIEGITSALDGVFVGIGDLATDKNSWLLYLQEHPLTICYELATPTTLTLTPAELELLKGANTVSGNGVTINISYLGR